MGVVSSCRGVDGREQSSVAAHCWLVGAPRGAGTWPWILGTICFMSLDAWGERQATSVQVCRNKAPILFVLKLTGNSNV